VQQSASLAHVPPFWMQQRIEFVESSIFWQIAPQQSLFGVPFGGKTPHWAPGPQ
jgi:hypothetical protein